MNGPVPIFEEPSQIIATSDSLEFITNISITRATSHGKGHLKKILL
jgi:hypothetical protein